MDYPKGENEYLRQLRLLEGQFHEMGADPALDSLVKEGQAHFGVKIAAVTLLTKDTQLLPARVGIDVDQTPRDLAFCNYTILHGDVFVVPDAQNDPIFRDHPLAVSEPFIRFYAGAPLTYLEGIRLGAFCLLDIVPRSFSLGDRAELTDFADRAVSILVSKMSLPR